MRPASEAWTAAIQNRVSRTAIVLSDMKAIKMIGLEPVMIKYLQALRTREIQCSIEARKIDIVKVSLRMYSPVFSALLYVSDNIDM